MTSCFLYLSIIFCVSFHVLFLLVFPDFFSEYTSSTESEISAGAKLSGSAGFGAISAEMSAEASTTSKTKSTTQNVIASMTIERYYSSVKEEVSPLADDAFTLLESQDYVGFFKACGPNYVRSIRRVQEVHAVFKFSTTSSETASSFAASLKVSTPAGGAEGGFSASSKFASATSSLTINILGYGMGLSADGSETMVATSISEYKDVMIYSFKSFTQNEDSYNIGMVYGMEVVPWVNNVAFQVAANLDAEVVEIPVPRSMIPRATHGTVGQVWATADRANWSCKATQYQIDRLGYCCEPLQLYHPTSKTYPGTVELCPLNTCVCQPVFNLDKSILKDNMANNGEFVARLDSAMRYKLVTLGVLEKCISALRAIPTSYDNRLLKSNDAVKFDKELSVELSVAHLRRAMDPLNDYGLIAQLGREMDEWIEMFYSTCLGSLYGMDIGSSTGTDVTYFMAYPWHTHDNCMKLSCITGGFRWDRGAATCIPGILNGYGTDGYTGEDHCAKDDETYDAAGETCKYPTTNMHRYHTSATNCWQHLPFTGVDYLMNHYCNPQMTGQSLSDADVDQFNTNVTNNCAGDSYHL